MRPEDKDFLKKETAEAEELLRYAKSNTLPHLDFDELEFRIIQIGRLIDITLDDIQDTDYEMQTLLVGLGLYNQLMTALTTERDGRGA